ncbi:MAG: electron transfer flavoprotein subunit beta/FixA family protein [Saprospiraceae bacterium]|nr:electron transfer flavoprotein subunit beta/FixA family protein [Saprospiraceae bacterium]
MKQLVCISSMPDTAAKISFTADQTHFNKEGVQYIMNPYDEWYALVRAVEMKEEHGGTITVCHVGTANNDTIIRKALAIGADEAVRVNKDPQDGYDVAVQIANVARDQEFDIIYTGKESIDYNAASVGAMLAELLDLPFISYANHMTYAHGKASVTREIEGGDEIVALPSPFILSASKGLAEQRIPNMRGIMMAKRKPLNVVEPVAVSQMARIVKYSTPPPREACEMIDPEDMDALVRKLAEEAKVI